MSQYMQELCDSLSRVLDRCAQFDRRRLAGYVQNIDFWVSEIEHRLALIDGYIERRKNMVAATKTVYLDEIQRNSGPGGNPVPDINSLTSPNVMDISANWDELNSEAIELRKQVLISAKKFVLRCLGNQLIDRKQLLLIEDRLNVNLRSRKPWASRQRSDK